MAGVSPHHGSHVVTAGFRGEPLVTLTGEPWELEQFLPFALRVTKLLARIHEHRFAHLNLQPRAILIDPQTSEVSLVPGSYAIAEKDSSLPKLEPMPAYLAPEQTGRLRWPADERSDLYTLGVIFYELLTDSPLFQAMDPLEWAHCHIARWPIPPIVCNPRIPPIVNDIVLKLLAKSADERYQSANGLYHDLEQCWLQLSVHAQIDAFPLGLQDRSGRLVFPQQLYGRTKEVALLLESFEEVLQTGQPSLMLIAGYSGVGKSALVAELHKPIIKHRGYFISGKFDQYQRGIPYATIVMAFRSLIQQLLTESESRIARWRQKILEAVGDYGYLIIDLIPQVALIIGSQPVIEELPVAEAQNRLHLVFQQFVSVFASSEYPLVLFLDDLQWMDAASFTLLANLMTLPGERNQLFIIGAYRDNEVGPTHPLMTMLEELCAQGHVAKTITLQPLEEQHVRQILSDTMHYPEKHVAPLARLVFAKTRGNPFFFFQFVTALYQDGMLRFNPEEQCWVWNLEELQARQFTENVVELMIGELQRLPLQTQRVLQLAGLLGNQFDLASLSLVAQQSPADTAAHLWPALQVGLIIRRGTLYRFLHDRVQEAAYALTPPEQLAELHAHIGRLLYEHLAEDELEEQLFAVTTHLNLGASMLQNVDERHKVAELNLRAGIKARATTAYAEACTYLSEGMMLLAANSWTTDYQLTYDLYMYRAECEYLSGNFALAEQLLQIIFSHTKTSVDRVQAYALNIYLYVTQGAITLARDTGLESLTELGVVLPAHPSDEMVQAAYQEVLDLVGDRPIEQLSELPELTDPQIQLVMRALAVLDAASFYTDSNLYTLRVCRMVALSLRHGNSEDSIHAYSHFGYLMSSIFHRYQDGYAFTNVAYDLCVRLNSARYRGQVHYFRGLSALWVRPLSMVIALQRDVLQMLIRNGELAYASMCSNYLVSNVLATGLLLEDVAQEAQEHLAFVQQVKFDDVADLIRPVIQVTKLLRGLTYTSTKLDDDTFSEDHFEATFTPERMPLVICRYYIAKLMAHCIMGDFAMAHAAAVQAQPLLWSIAGFQEMHNYTYFAALALASIYDDAAPKERAQYLETLQGYLDQLMEWTESNQETFGCTAALVSAELSRIREDDLVAMRSYEQAIESARTYGFVQHQALANEFAARFYQKRKFATIAATYLREAHICYALWGADGKVRQITEQNPHLLDQKPILELEPPTPAHRLDVFASIKASQAISGELTLDMLLDTLMRVTMEQAGADYGAFLSCISSRQFQIDAEAWVEGQRIQVHTSSQLVPNEADLPMSIITYVQRTREALVLDVSRASSPIAEDLARITRDPKSVLCLPIMRQAELLGVLYLENRLMAGAFTPDRLDMLQILGAQAAISLENARLYTNLRHENAERRRAEARIMAALAEKELLLGEIHHRVKNNLQVISSLFSLQADGVKDPEARNLLRASESRVRAMALIHQRLYRFNNLEEINFAEYTRDLVAALYQAHGVDDETIICQIDSAGISLGINIAVSCGLLINELVANALRHAFPDSNTGQILIHFQQEADGKYRLTVEDNGIGVSDEALIERPGHLGLVLVRELVEQIGGTLEISSDHGTAVIVRFRNVESTVSE